MSSTPDPPGGTASHPHPVQDDDEGRQADPPAENSGPEETRVESPPGDDPSLKNSDSKTETPAQSPLDPDSSPQKVSSVDGASVQQRSADPNLSAKDVASTKEEPASRLADPDPSVKNIESHDEAASQRSTDSGPFNDNVKELHRLLWSMEASKKEDGENTKKEGDENKDPKNEHRGLSGILGQLTEAQINASDPMSGDETALHIAAKQGLLEAAKALIQKQASVSVKDFVQNQPLHYASKEGHLDLVKLLVKNGADVLAVDGRRRSPLYWASEKGHTEVAKFLFGKDKTNIDTAPFTIWTPLNRACLYGHAKTVRALLEGGASLLVIRGITPLSIATTLGHKDVLDALLELKKDDCREQLEILDPTGQTPLMIAIRHQFFEGVEKLLGIDANCNATSDRGASCLHWALWEFSTEIFNKMLEQSGLKIDVTDPEGRTVLHYICGASRRGQDPFTVEKEAEKAKTNEGKTDEGKTDEGKTADEEKPTPPTDYGVLEQLLKRSPNLKLRTPHGETAMGFAVQHRKTALILPLLELGGPELLGDVVMPMEGSDGAMHFEGIREKIVADLCKHEHLFHKVLFWSAADKARHSLAKSLLRHEQPEGEGKGGIKHISSAIEWAIHRRFPKILWWLIATSPRDSQTVERIDRAKAVLDKLFLEGNEANRRATSSRGSSTESPSKVYPTQADDLDDTGSPKMGPSTLEAAVGARGADDSAQEDTPAASVDQAREEEAMAATKNLEFMRNILKDPPTGLVYREPSALTRPKRKADEGGILSDFNACAMRFYRGDSISGTIRRNPTVDEVMYAIGPTKVMMNAANELKGLLEIDSARGTSGFGLEEVRGLYDKKKLRFTWIHLPVTNVRELGASPSLSYVLTVSRSTGCR